MQENEASIDVMEREVLYKNPYLKSIFQNSDFLFKRPITINEISFERKTPVYQHILMTGDAAGMITPLCGNGMAIAIHTAKLCAEAVLQHRQPFNREAWSDNIQRSGINNLLCVCGQEEIFNGYLAVNG